MSKHTDPTISFEEYERRALRAEREQRLQEARDAFDKALHINPSAQSVVEGRARIAMQLDEEGAAKYCERALAFHESDPELQIQMIATAATYLGIAAIPLLESYLSRHSQDVAAHELLAELRAQAGEGDEFIGSYNQAIRSHPNDKRLLFSYWNTLTRAQRPTEALQSMDANRGLFVGDREFTLLEVQIANNAGLTDRAGEVLDHLDHSPDAQIARGQHRLQTNRLEEAAELLEGAVRADPDNLAAWALLEVAWRLTANGRHEWLTSQPGLVGTHELDLDSAQLSQIAAMLRTLHRSKSQPIGQSVRGGTQTLGQLFLRSEPEILLLTTALAAAIREFHGQLPPLDHSHPLLKHRDQGLAFGPSWSVRFTGSGHHAAHFHPGGILSSACYICVPETLADSEEEPGWLEIGRPPPELGLDLPPLATFEPKPGRLVLFPSFLFHGTRPFQGGERLTVAFDLVPVPMS